MTEIEFEQLKIGDEVEYMNRKCRVVKKSKIGRFQSALIDVCGQPTWVMPYAVRPWAGCRWIEQEPR